MASRHRHQALLRRRPNRYKSLVLGELRGLGHEVLSAVARRGPVAHVDSLVGVGIVNAERDNQLLILEAAAKANQRAGDFKRLLAVFGLPAGFRPHLLAALRERGWRSSPEPFRHLRSAVLAKAVEPDAKSLRKATERVTVKPARGEDFSDAITALDRTDSGDSDEESWFERVNPAFVIENEPSPQVAERCLDPIRKLDVDAIARKAQLDHWETAALRAMVSGVGLRAAMAQCEDGRQLRAAWMRLERKKSRLAELLRKPKPQVCNKRGS
jgi:hypothetical protein